MATYVFSDALPFNIQHVEPVQTVRDAYHEYMRDARVIVLQTGAETSHMLNFGNIPAITVSSRRPENDKINAESVLSHR